MASRAPGVTVFTLASPATEHQIGLCSAIRLHSLKTNPESFGSSYERESLFTREQWLERFDSPGRATFIACHKGETNDQNSVADTLALEKWIGCVTILGPESLKNIPFEFPSSLSETREAVYHIVGTWVDPEFRKLGIGHQLMKVALTWAQHDKAGDGDAKKVVLVRVHQWNIGAQAVYQSVGFSKGIDGEEDHDDDELWMAYQVPTL